MDLILRRKTLYREKSARNSKSWWLSRVAALWLVAGVRWCRCQDSQSDTGYTFPTSTLLTDGQEFEYIVVGAGGAGAAAAARLALAGRSVLLVEAGGDPDEISKIPGASGGLLGSPLDWQYDTLSNHKSCLSYRDRQCRFSRGRCLGGSTSINYMMYTRGSPQDWDDLGIANWTWNDVRPFFLYYEGLQQLDRLPPSSIPYHNTTGTMRVEFFTDPENPWHSRLLTAYEDLNIPFNPDVNAQSQIGATKVLGYVWENERMSTARGYLARPDVKAHLKVAKSTQCTGIILDENNEAKGITVAYGLLKNKLRLYATKEVILSAGAIGTPQILMLSGIGPAEHLKKFNIPVKLDLPVGDNMTDHVFPLMFVKVDYGAAVSQDLLEVAKTATQFAELLLLKKGPLASNGLTDITTFFNSNCYDFDNRQLKNNCDNSTLPNFQFIHAFLDRKVVTVGGPLFQHGTDLNDNVVKQLQKVNADYAFLVISPGLLRPHSFGTVRLASADPLKPPAITPNFLSDDRDLEELVQSVTILEHAMETKPFKSRNATLVHLELDGCPSYEEDTKAYWACYCRHLTHTSYHSVGTAALGRVLDGELRVKGARRLRVADLSAMPSLLRANTAASAIAMGERVAHFILTGK